MSVSRGTLESGTCRHNGGAADRRQVSATRGSTYGRPALLGAYHTPFLLLPATADADPGWGSRSSRDVAAARGGRAEGSDSDSQFT